MLLIFYFFISTVYSFGYNSLGSLWPSGQLAISNSYTNVGLYANYTITFTPDTRIPAGGILSITFPEQYEDKLGTQGNPTCSPNICTNLGKTISITLPNAVSAQSTYSVTIQNILNPLTVGGTGSFQVSSTYQGAILDWNSAFGVIGISDAKTTLKATSVSVLSGSSSVAGDITIYLFTFQFDQIIVAGSAIRFTFPGNGFYLAPYPTCTSYATEGMPISGSLKCITTGRQVILSGISADLQPNILYSVRMTGTNPKWKVNTGTFTIDVFRFQTFTLYQQATLIPGLSISAGNLLSLTFGPVDSSLVISRNKILLFSVTFTTKNPIEKGGYIIIVFPWNFALSGNYIAVIGSGLKDINATSEATVSYDIPTTTLTISNFDAVDSQTQISLYLQIQCPYLSGKSSALNIKSYRADKSTVIDQDITNAYTTVSSYSSPSISISFPGSSKATGASITIDFTITPNIQIPANGYITFKIPAAFGTTGLVCKLTPYAVGQDYASSCTLTGSILKVQLFLTTTNSPAGSGAFPLGVQSIVSLTLVSPTVSGDYYFDINTYDTSNTLLESGNTIATLTAPTFSSISITPVHTANQYPTILIFTMTADYQIPAGIVGTSYTDIRGYIEITFPTQSSGNALFPLDLGLGIQEGSTFPCRGISNIAGQSSPSLTCTLTTLPSVASSGTPVIVTVTGFTTIAAGTSFTFHIPNIYYIQTTNTASVIVTSYSKLNRIRTDIQSSSVSVSAGSTGPASSSTATSLTLSTTQVQSSTTLSSASITISSGAGSNPYLLLEINPIHDSGYCNYNTISCLYDGTSSTCYCYPGIDLILISLSSLTAASHTFSVSGLINPESSGITDGFNLYAVKGAAVLDAYTYSSNIPALTPGVITDFQCKIDQNYAALSNIRYEFSFTLIHDIPTNGSILITMPSGSYSLHYSTPIPYCSSILFSQQDYTSSCTCTPYGNTVTISGIPNIKSGSFVDIFVQGIKNPGSVGTIGNFKYQTKNSNGGVIDEATTVTGPTLTSVWTVQTISDLKMINYPNNAGATAEYIFSFTTLTSLGAGGYIEIEFPTAQFGILTNPPDCRATGATSALSSCEVYGKSLLGTIGANIGGMSNFHIFGVKNFNAGISDDFSIKAYYDGVLLQQTSGSVTISTTAAASTISVSAINFYPKNEGQTATYEFTMIPSVDIDSSEYIIITFPRSYDHRIGDNLDCWATGISGFIKCQVIQAWSITIYDHDYFSACSSCSFTIFIFGVINPNYSYTDNTGDFSIGIISSYTYTQLNEQAGELDIEPAPHYSNILSTTFSNTYARTSNNIAFNITTTGSIPTSKEKGQVWVNFPTDYVIDGSSITCTTSSQWSSGSPTFVIDHNIVKIDADSSTSLAGNLLITLSNVPNPLSNINAQYISVQVYDGYTRILTMSSFINLNPNRAVFSYPGPLITVNSNNPFEVQSGAMSDFIPIALSYPCGLNLTLIPYSQGFTFIPTSISLSTGDSNQQFRVSAPPGTRDKEYTIQWTILGDYSPPYYTPILKSFFTVTQNVTYPITIATIPPVPAGGHSLPIEINIGVAPYSDASIILSVGTQNYGIKIVPDKIEFTQGAYLGYFTVYVSTDTILAWCPIYLTLIGTNSKVYSLQSNTTTFNIFRDDSDLPVVSGVSIQKFTRTSTTAMITTNKVCTVYYAFALQGTITPNFTELIQAGPPSYNTTQTVYGKVYMYQNSAAYITISSLLAQTKYTLFYMAKDLTDKNSKIVGSYDFETLSRYKPATANLWFAQTYLTTVELSLAQEAIALVLSLHPWRVVINTQNETTRRLSSSSDTVRTVLNVYLLDHPAYDTYVEPGSMVSMLNSAETKLGELLTNFDTTRSITGNALNIAGCQFKQSPSLLGTNTYSIISFSASLYDSGIIFGVAVASDTDTGTPFSQQIVAGHDRANRPVLNAKSTVSAGVVTSLTFKGLEADTHYNVYITCGNSLPGYPDLLDDSSVVTLKWKTDTKPANTMLNLDGGEILCGFLISVIMTLV
ncbi:unnamed protein product [Blepharisma stoltei]|uniref:Uncharacterized protein n=1 Tax=Blepharisma stoltei TaxID=1481888 RepID=A0AAU9IA82_9CILI|nr:unnamed protein product [Blepharisma stoltei]